MVGRHFSNAHGSGDVCTAYMVLWYCWCHMRKILLGSASSLDLNKCYHLSSFWTINFHRMFSYKSWQSNCYDNVCLFCIICYLCHMLSVAIKTSCFSDCLHGLWISSTVRSRHATTTTPSASDITVTCF